MFVTEPMSQTSCWLKTSVSLNVPYMSFTLLVSQPRRAPLNSVAPPTKDSKVVAFAVSQQIGSFGPDASRGAVSRPPRSNEKSVTSDVSTQQPTCSFGRTAISHLSSALVDGEAVDEDLRPV